MDLWYVIPTLNIQSKNQIIIKKWLHKLLEMLIEKEKNKIWNDNGGFQILCPMDADSIPTDTHVESLDGLDIHINMSPTIFVTK